jgi:hypothetical protein
MGLDLAFIDGQTPLDEEEKEGLLIPTIATRGELDEFEQEKHRTGPAVDFGAFLYERHHFYRRVCADGAQTHVC